MKKYNRRDIDNTELCHEYWDLKVSAKELGHKYHCSPQTIANRLCDIGVGVRGKEGMRRKSWSNSEGMIQCTDDRSPITKISYEINEQWVLDKYIGSKWSPKQIANAVGCGATTISRTLNKMGATLRSRSDAGKCESIIRKKKKKEKSYKFNISKEELEYKYLVEMKSAPDIAKEYNCSAPLVLQKMDKFGIRKRSGADAHKTKSYADKIKGHRVEKNGEDYYKLPEDKPKVGQLIDGKLLGRLHPHMWHKCPMCGKERWVAMGNLRNSKTGGLCAKCMNQDEDLKKRRADINNRRYENPEERDKTAESSRRMWAEDPERRAKHAEFLKGVVNAPENRKKQVEAITKYWNDPTYSEERKKKVGDRGRIHLNAMWSDPVDKEERIRKHGIMQKGLWANPEYKDKQSKVMRIGCEARPTKPEIVVIDILNKLYPNEWKYVGDGEIIIEGKNPDIINVNGKKAIIEVFGTYWHSMEVRKECPLIHELNLKDLYAKYGYKTLIVWQHELKDEGSAVKKIKEFCAIVGLHNEV